MERICMQLSLDGVAISLNEHVGVSLVLQRCSLKRLSDGSAMKTNASHCFHCFSTDFEWTHKCSFSWAAVSIEALKTTQCTPMHYT